jgi:hypothetical protein
MLGRHGGKLRIDQLAALKGHRAARVETAPGRNLNRVGRGAF